MYILKKEFGKYTEIDTKIALVQEIIIAKELSKLTSIVFFEYNHIFSSSGKLYVSYQYCTGGSLYHENERRLAANTPWTEDEMLYLFAQVALMLKFLKENKTLHRKINTMEIKFETPEKKNLKLGDFGSAKKFNDISTKPRPEFTIKNDGIKLFKAPELYSDGKPLFQYSADVWAAGMVLFSIATLDLPEYEKVEEALDTRLNNFTEPAIPELIKKCLIEQESERITG